MPAPPRGLIAPAADRRMGGSVQPVLQPHQSLLGPPSEVFLCVAPEIFGLPGRKGKWKEGEREASPWPKPASSSHSFPAGMEGKERSCSEKVSEVRRALTQAHAPGPQSLPGVSPQCTDCHPPWCDPTLPTECSQESQGHLWPLCGCPMTAPWLCGPALWVGVCIPRYYWCEYSRISHGQEKISTGARQLCLSWVRFILKHKSFLEWRGSWQGKNNGELSSSPGFDFDLLCNHGLLLPLWASLLHPENLPLDPCLALVHKVVVRRVSMPLIKRWQPGCLGVDPSWASFLICLHLFLTFKIKGIISFPDSTARRICLILNIDEALREYLHTACPRWSHCHCRHHRQEHILKIIVLCQALCDLISFIILLNTSSLFQQQFIVHLCRL